MYCASFHLVLPESFPVTTHAGIATLRVTEVGERNGSVLLCDGGHSGAHHWPDGEAVVNPETSSAGSGGFEESSIKGDAHTFSAQPPTPGEANDQQNGER